MGYTLYGAPDSANLVIHLILEQLEVDYELVWVDRSRQAHRHQDFLANLNPQGLLPVLVDDGQPIFETAAIALHLTDKHQALAPQGLASPERAHFLQWLFYLSNTLHADLRMQFYPHRHVSETGAIPALLAQTQVRIKQHFQLIENTLAKRADGPWFCGAKFSVLDIYLAALWRWSLLYPRGQALNPDLLADLPHLYELLIALEQHPTAHNVLPLHQVKAPFFTQPSFPDLPAEQVSAS
jgi:glutathione S-transferase